MTSIMTIFNWFVGASYGPFVIEADPAAPEFTVRDITLPTSITSDRNARRQTALRELNAIDGDTGIDVGVWTFGRSELATLA